ncbi:MAG: glycosyltransferase family 4 protein [Gemmataceae bacterium]
MRIRIRDGRPGLNTPETTGAIPAPRQVIGRLLEPVAAAPESNLAPGSVEKPPVKPPIAVFCHEPPDSFIGRHVIRTVHALAELGRTVHVFCRQSFPLEGASVRMHVVGNGFEGDLVEEVQQFARKASNVFLQVFPNGENVQVVGYEWTCAPVLALLKGLRNQSSLLSLHSLEQQRSDLSNELSRRIVEIEHEGIAAASKLLMHDPATIDVARQRIPTCAERIIPAYHVFSADPFERELDPGAVKARYQVGPIDPTILFVGDLDERYGPDLALRAMPAILRHHPQARLVIVGEGHLLWPLKVYARYLLLEHAIRLPGHVTGQALLDLIQASDLIIVPSRSETPWWPIQMGWAARKPVVATHDAARGLTEHEKDCVLVYPSENSIVWGVERVLYDEELRQSLARSGHQKLEHRFGWKGLAEQLEELLASLPPR